MWHSELTTALATGCQPAAIVHCGLNYARCVVVQTTTVYDLTHVVGTVWYAILKFPVFQQIVVNYILLPCISIVTFIAYRHTLPASVDTQIGHVTTTYTALCPGSKAPQQWDVNIALAERPTCSSINYTSNIYTYSPLFSQMHVVSYLVLLLLFLVVKWGLSTILEISHVKKRYQLSLSSRFLCLYPEQGSLETKLPLIRACKLTIQFSPSLPTTCTPLTR